MSKSSFGLMSATSSSSLSFFLLLSLSYTQTLTVNTVLSFLWILDKSEHAEPPVMTLTLTVHTCWTSTRPGERIHPTHDRSVSRGFDCCNDKRSHPWMEKSHNNNSLLMKVWTKRHFFNIKSHFSFAMMKHSYCILRMCLSSLNKLKLLLLIMFLLSVSWKQCTNLEPIQLVDWTKNLHCHSL